jgi:acetyltransferase-like isoleucine patch superfamily enzyme
VEVLENQKSKSVREIIKSVTPHFGRLIAKRIYTAVVHRHNKMAYIKKDGYVEFGYFFRFTRKHPYLAMVGAETIADRYNIWNAKRGDIIVGSNCWFGLNNIIMGPVEIGDFFSTGPSVSILGPRHLTLGYEPRERDKTVIGKNVMIATGAIVTFGVSIGDNAIIGAGSVVTKDVADGAFVSGNPARDLTKMVSKLWKMDYIVQERFRDK